MVLEKTLESPLDSKEIQPVHPKGDWSLVFIGGTDVEAETPILWPPHEKSWLIWKKPWCWEWLKAGEEGDNRGWDGWMASLTQWRWVWVNSRSWWWTGRPGACMHGGAWKCAAVHGVAKSQTRLDNWTELHANYILIKLTKTYPGTCIIPYSKKLFWGKITWIWIFM